MDKVFMASESIELVVPQEYNFERIDKFLRNALEIDLSRTYIQKLIKDNNITVNGKEIKQNYRLKQDDNIIVSIPEPEELVLEPQDIPVDILYEDDVLAVINKPPGLVVHPGCGNWDRTLVNALLFHLKELSSIGGVIRPGIVHRLDKDTSGLMVIAKNDAAHKALSDDFAERKVVKKYAAIVAEKPGESHGFIDKPIARHPVYRHKMTIAENGKESLTEFTIKNIWNTGSGIFTLLDITLHTGRTHQIRVHLSSIGHPVVGDPVYSKKWAKQGVPYLMLASVHLEFRHPVTGLAMCFDIPIPQHMSDFIKRIDN